MIFIPVFRKPLLPCFVLVFLYLLSIVFDSHITNSFVSPSQQEARFLSLFFDRTISCIARSWKEKKHYPPLRYSNALINSYVITLTPYHPGLNSALFTPRPRVPSSFFFTLHLIILFIVICFYALTHLILRWYSKNFTVA